MINKDLYVTIQEASEELKAEVEKLKELKISKINDFLSTVEGYTKYLENNVKLNQDADNAIKDLIK